MSVCFLAMIGILYFLCRCASNVHPSYCICLALNTFTDKMFFLAGAVVNFVVRRAFDEQVQASGGVLRGVRVPEMVRHKALIGLRWVHLEMQGGEKSDY